MTQLQQVMDVPTVYERVHVENMGDFGLVLINWFAGNCPCVNEDAAKHGKEETRREPCEKSWVAKR